MSGDLNLQGCKYLFSKYNLQIEKNGAPIYILINNLIIFFISLFAGLFFKNKNYLFFILAFVFLIIHLIFNAIIIGFSLGIANL